jgi:uncharacterized membrane protein
MASPVRHRLLLVRIVSRHIRLVVSSLIGAILFVLLLPTGWPLTTRLLLSWDITCAIYLAWALRVISRFDLQAVRRLAASEDEGATLVLVLTVSAAIASLAAVILELGPMKELQGQTFAFAFALVAGTVLLSWTFVHVIFAFHYAHEYYGEGDSGAGLDFPDDERVDKPDYWDFVYFSLVIGMTSQVSDVQVTSKGVRRVVAAHGVVSFFFNVAILALTVNLAAGLV